MDTSFEFGWNVKDNEDPWGGAHRQENSQEDQEIEQTCSYVKKQVRLITSTIKKLNREVNMKKLPDAKPISNGRPSKLPDPEMSTGDFNPFLKASHIGKKGSKLILTGEMRDAGPDSFSDIIVVVKMGSKLYDWGIKFDSGNYSRLHKRFGSNPAKWKGTVQVNVGNFRGKDYVQLKD